MDHLTMGPVFALDYQACLLFRSWLYRGKVTIPHVHHHMCSDQSTLDSAVAQKVNNFQYNQLVYWSLSNIMAPKEQWDIGSKNDAIVASMWKCSIARFGTN